MTAILLTGFIAALLASVAGGIVGSYIVVKRIVFITGSIAHSVLGGMGLFLYLSRTTSLTWLSPLYGALLTALLAAFTIGWIHLKHRQREDTVIAALWALGMAVGVIFTSLTPGYNVELMRFLFGNILWTSGADLWILFALDLLVIAIVLPFHKKFLAICFDEEQAYLQGQNVQALYFLLLGLTAITVVLLIQIIGAILVVAMLCLPAAIAGMWTNRLSQMIFVAVGLSLLFSGFGWSAAYILNWPPGATIALFATIAYFIGLPIKQKI